MFSEEYTMKNIYNDNDYLNIIEDILYNKNFNKIDNNIHHGLSRLDHSLRVSYYSYKISKKLLLNYKETARAGLLHDFFMKEELTKKEQMVSAFIHPSKALENSNNNFYLTDMEKNIIEAHMFPLIPNKIPKYLEAWIVSAVDKVVATYEFSYSYGSKALCKLPSAYVISLLLLLRF
jgi:uncharacterized protein